MAESTYHQMSVQHIHHLAQSNSPEPVALVHQQQAAGEQPTYPPLEDMAQQVQDTEQYRRQQALVTIQALEQQRLGLIHPRPQ